MRKYILCLLTAILLLTSCGSNQAAGPQGKNPSVSVGKAGQDQEKSRNPKEDLPVSDKVDAPIIITCFNVGKGDAFLLATPNSAVLIDTGYKADGDDLVDYIKDKGIEKLDALIISHFDKDHVGGAAKVVKQIPVDMIFTTYKSNDDKRTKKFFEALDETGELPEIVTEKTYLTLDDIDYEISPPLRPHYPDKDDNNSSLLVRVSYGQSSMLFTGDAEDYRIQEILNEESLESTILKIPYHGEFQKSLPALVQAVSPKYAIITCSDEEPEDEETNLLLEQMGVESFLTRNGGIIITMDGEKVNISQ
ncbi:MAG: MBL fold metallo-hydrolase [Lachnospiraceae bacterium]|nr:MBL fold metallo-hydrolase [Lachnospiraceae bacterium]